MNRTIFHKAKRKADDEWIFGYPVPRLTLNDMVMDLAVVDLKDMKIHTYEIYPETLCGFTGVSICERSITDDEAYCREHTKIFTDDIINIYTITYDDDDYPVREKVAEVQVKYDKKYGFAFAECIFGTINDIAEKCDISYLNDDYDIPFSYFVETMENEQSNWWEWEVIGNKCDNN